MKQMKPPAYRSPEDIETYRQEMMELLRQDPLVYPKIRQLQVNQKMVNQYLALFLDYRDDIHACHECPGLTRCNKAYPFMQLSIEVDDDHLERRLTFCPLMQKKRDIDRRFVARDYPESWWMRSLLEEADFDGSRQSRLEFMTVATEYFGEHHGRGFYLYGNTGLGKSYAVALLLQDLIAREPTKKAAFIHLPTQIKALQELAFQSQTLFNEKIVELTEVNYLVIDDFGSEHKSDYVRDAIVYPLLSQRAKNHQVTFITSRFSLNQIKLLYGTTPAAKVMAEQLTAIVETLIDQKIKWIGLPVY